MIIMKTRWAISLLSLNNIKISIALLVGILFSVSSCTSPKKESPKTYKVEIAQMQFQPAELTVRKGDTVLFENKDMVAHDVTEVNKAWTSSELSSGSSWKWVATKSADYYCNIHLVMRGKIIVD